MNIVLTGYRCTGKTTVGRLLADMCGLVFRDTDELVCLRTGETIAETVSRRGWDAFRKEERSVIAEITREDGMVIATGGGAVLDATNVDNLRKNGKIVWLVAAADTIVARLENDPSGGKNRPSFSGEAIADEVRQTLAKREKLYRRGADMVVHTDNLPVPDVTALIYRLLSETVNLSAFSAKSRDAGSNPA